MENKEDAQKIIGAFADKMKKFEEDHTVFGIGHGPKDAFPLEISNINFKVSKPLSAKPIATSGKVGDRVAVRPVSGEGEGETFFGVLVGFVDYKPAAIYNKETKEMTFSMSGANPAIYIFQLKRTVFGFESYWKVLAEGEEVKEITEKDIDNLWYVKAMKEKHGSREAQG